VRVCWVGKQLKGSPLVDGFDQGHGSARKKQRVKGLSGGRRVRVEGSSENWGHDKKKGRGGREGRTAGT